MTMDVEGVRKYNHKHPVSKDKLQICSVGFLNCEELTKKIDIEKSKEGIKQAVAKEVISDRLGVDIFNIKAEDGNNPNKVKVEDKDMEPGE